MTTATIYPSVVINVGASGLVSITPEMTALRNQTVAAAGQAAADRTQTGLDRTATGQDRTAVAADRVQTGLDRTQTGLDAVATAADRVQTGQDRVQTGLDRTATGQDRTAVAADRTAVATDRSLAQTARADAVAAAPVATDAAAQALVYRDQAALYAGSFGPGMILHRTDEAIPTGWWDTGLRQSATSELWGNTATLALISNWSTASLYMGGIATAFFDFSTVSREFQDVFGTALTAAGQSVAMVRDAITAPTFGASIVTNGDFAADANWTKGTGWTISGGSANKAAGTAASLTQAVTLTAGRTYRIAGTATVTAGTVTPRFTGGTLAAGTAISAGGNFEQYITAATGNTTLDFLGSSTFTGSIDNVSVQEVLGIVATQPSASLRGRWASWPVIGRRNLMAVSEQMTGAPWSLTNASITQVGSSFRLVANAGSTGRIDQAYTVTNNGRNETISLTAKADGARYVHVGRAGAGGWFDLQTGTVVSAMAGQSLSVSGLDADGFYRLSVTYLESTVANGSTTQVRISPSVNVPSSSSSTAGGNDGVGGILLKNAQRELGSVATPYQRVNSVDEIIESGVRNSGMWRPDLVDDSLTFTLPAAVDGELILLGRDGSWRETRLASSGSQVVIGGTGAGTLATPGILRATGPLVAMGFRQGAMTADEWLRLKRRWRAEGARGELIAGANLILNSAFADASNWTLNTGWSIAGGIATHAAGTQSELVQSITVTPGLPYLVGYDVVAVRAAGALSMGGQAGVYTTLESTPTVGVGKRGVWVPSSTGEFRFRVAAAGDIDIDNVTVQPLTPEW